MRKQFASTPTFWVIKRRLSQLTLSRESLTRQDRARVEERASRTPPPASDCGSPSAIASLISAHPLSASSSRTHHFSPLLATTAITMATSMSPTLPKTRARAPDPNGLPLESLTVEEIGQASRSAQIDGVGVGGLAGFLGGVMSLKVFKSTRNASLLSGLLCDLLSSCPSGNN